MSVYKRYFKITAGPAIKEYKRCADIRRLARAEIAAICGEIGAKREWYALDSGKPCALIFDTPPDRNIYKKVKQGWYPKKNSPEGKAIAKRFDAIESVDLQAQLLEIFGLGRGWCLWGGNKVYAATITVIPKARPVIFLQVPWRDVDPADLRQYKRDRKAEKVGPDMDMDHLQWRPSKAMTEVKSWQVERAVEQWNKNAEVSQ